MIRVADAVGKPERYVGQIVTVEADVEELLGRVVRMNVVEIEREIGWELDRKIEVGIEGRGRPSLRRRSNAPNAKARPG